MTLLQRLRWALSGKDSQARIAIAQSNPGQAVFTPARYDKLSEEGFQKNSVAFRCVGLIGKSIGELDWLLYSKTRRGQAPTEVLNSPLLELLDRPNPLQGTAAFFEHVAAFLMLSGNSYIEAAGPGPSKPPMELWPQRPDRMTLTPGPNGLPAKFTYKVDGRSRDFLVDQVKGKSPILHLKTFNPLNDWYGMSPIQAAAMAIDQHNDAGRWNASLLQNSARPSGFFTVTPSQFNPSATLGDAQFKRLKTDIEERYSGARNAGRPGLLEGGVDWKATGLTPVEMDFLEGKKMSAREIAFTFGVPAMLVGIPGDNTYANYKEARLAFYEDTILPLADFIRDELNHWLVPSYGDKLFMDYDRDAIEALAPKRAEQWDRLQNADFLTINEKRESVGYSPLADGDTILVQSTMVPLEQAVAEPEADPEDPAADGGAQDDGDGMDSEMDPNDMGQDMGGKGLKFVALKNPADRMKEWRRQQKMRGPFERRLKSQIRTLFQIQGADIAKALNGSSVLNAEHVAARIIDEQGKSFQTALEKAYHQCGMAFGKRTLGQIKAGSGPTERKDSEVRFTDWLSTWIKNNLGAKITAINETSRDRVLKEIRDAAAESNAEGEGAVPLSDRIEKIYDDFSDYRADRIARTETVTAMNVAQNGAAKASGVPDLQKEWLSAEDERVRPSHADADGQIVGMEDQFKVGGAAMDHPADPQGPADEVINCRCTLAIVPPSAGSGEGE